MGYPKRAYRPYEVLTGGDRTLIVVIKTRLQKFIDAVNDTNKEMDKLETALSDLGDAWKHTPSTL